MLAAACGDDDSDSSATTAAAVTTVAGAGTPTTGASGGSTPTSGGAGGKIIVGSADFPENQLLAQIYGQALAQAGFEVDYKLAIGSREVYYKAIEAGEIDLVPEYTNSLLTYVLRLKDPEAVSDAKNVEEQVADLGRQLPDTLEVLTPSTAEDKDVIGCTADAADEVQPDRPLVAREGVEGHHHRCPARVRDPLAVRPRRLQGDLRRRLQVVRAAAVLGHRGRPVGRPDRLRQPAVDVVGDRDRGLRRPRGRQEHPFPTRPSCRSCASRW